MKLAIEAYTASLLPPPPPTTICQHVLNLRAPKATRRTLSELYTLRKWSSAPPSAVVPAPVLFAPNRISKFVGRS